MKKSKKFLLLICTLCFAFCGILFAACEMASSVSVTGVTLSSTQETLRPGESVSLTATVSPADATNTNVVWSSSATDIATVSNGMVTGVARGRAVITVETVDGHFSATCSITVNDAVSVTGITLDSTQKSVNKGDNFTLTATVAPDNASDKTVIWSSSNPEVASVIGGNVMTLAVGEATITAKTQDGNFTASCAVTVNGIPVTGVALNATEADTGVEDSITLTATVSPANASNLGVSWTSSNPAVATVNNGKVTGVAAGTTVITAKTQDGNFTATCSVTVHAYQVKVVDSGNAPLANVTLTVRTGSGECEMKTDSNGIAKNVNDQGTTVVVRDSNPLTAVASYPLVPGMPIGYFYEENGGVITLNTQGLDGEYYVVTMQGYSVEGSNWIATDNYYSPETIRNGVYATEIISVEDPETGTQTPSTTYVRLEADTGNKGSRYNVTVHSDSYYYSDGVSQSGYLPIAHVAETNKYLVTTVLGSSFSVCLHPGEHVDLEFTARFLKTGANGESEPFRFVFSVVPASTGPDALPAEGSQEIYPYLAELGKSNPASAVNNKGAGYYVLDVSEKSTIIPGGGKGKVRVDFAQGTMEWKKNTGAEGGYTPIESGQVIEILGGNFVLFHITGGTSFTLTRVYSQGEREKPFKLGGGEQPATTGTASVTGIVRDVNVYRYVQGGRFSQETTVMIKLSVGNCFAVSYLDGDDEIELVSETDWQGSATIPANKDWFIKLRGDAGATTTVTVETCEYEIDATSGMGYILSSKITSLGTSESEATYIKGKRFNDQTPILVTLGEADINSLHYSIVYYDLNGEYPLLNADSTERVATIPYNTDWFIKIWGTASNYKITVTKIDLVLEAFNEIGHAATEIIDATTSAKYIAVRAFDADTKLNIFNKGNGNFQVFFIAKKGVGYTPGEFVDVTLPAGENGNVVPVLIPAGATCFIKIWEGSGVQINVNIVNGMLANPFHIPMVPQGETQQGETPQGSRFMGSQALNYVGGDDPFYVQLSLSFGIGSKIRIVCEGTVELVYFNDYGREIRKPVSNVQYTTIPRGEWYIRVTGATTVNMQVEVIETHA